MSVDNFLTYSVNPELFGRRKSREKHPIANIYPFTAHKNFDDHSAMYGVNRKIKDNGRYGLEYYTMVQSSITIDVKDDTIVYSSENAIRKRNFAMLWANFRPCNFILKRVRACLQRKWVRRMKRWLQATIVLHLCGAR